MRVSVAIPEGLHLATRGLPTGLAGDLLQNFAPEPQGIAFLGKPLRGPTHGICKWSIAMMFRLSLQP